jgi:hypothetical protein
MGQGLRGGLGGEAYMNPAEVISYMMMAFGISTKSMPFSAGNRGGSAKSQQWVNGSHDAPLRKRISYARAPRVRP